MTVVAAIAGFVAILTSWIVGLRLLGLARRTRQLPELLMGATFVMTGGVWSPLAAAGRQATMLSEEARTLLVAIGAIAGMTGLTLFALFNWRVFRPEARWAAALTAAVALALVGSFVAQSAALGWWEYARAERGPWRIGSWVGVLIYSWSTLEAWRQYRMLFRRRALGLADPVVTDRMRLWALAMGSALTGMGVLTVCQALGIPAAGTVIGLLVTAVVSLATSAFLLLAFLPPARYLARVRAAAAGA